jgi:hypothetical protein
MEVEILREALSKAYSTKSNIAAAVVAERQFPMKRFAETLGVSRSNLASRAREALRWVESPSRLMRRPCCC